MLIFQITREGAPDSMRGARQLMLSGAIEMNVYLEDHQKNAIW